MKEYISTIIYISIFSIILELILPNSKLKKYITTLVGLLIVIVVASPVINFLKNDDVILALSNFVDEIVVEDTAQIRYDFSKKTNSIINNSVKEKIELDIENTCEKELKEYNISNVNLSLDGNYNISEINITVGTDIDVEDAKKIINYITDTYNVQEQVINVIKGE